MNKTLVNIVYNGLYQVMILLLPFVTVSYVARVLGTEALGINAYINAIPVFLSVIILFGMNQFGVKTIAQTKKENLPRVFGRLWRIQSTVGIIMILGYLGAVVFFLNYKFYFLLELPFLIGYILDISWLYVGLGEIKTVITRNTLIKLSIVALIFICVRSQSDLWIYLIINSVTYLANAVFWLDLPKHLGRHMKKTDLQFYRPYFNQALMITVPSIAVQFYVSFDQTLVGWLAGNTELSFYSQSQFLARALITAIGSVSTILMPKMAKMLITEADQTKTIALLKKACDYTLLISCYFMVAFMINARQFVVWLWGRSFAPMAPVLFLSSCIIVLVSYGGVFANQYTLSRGLFKEYALPYYIGAVVSILLNLLIVPHFLAMGGAITIVLTELIVCVLRIALVHKELPLRTLIKGEYKVLLASSVTLAVGLALPITAFNLFFNLVSQTIILTLIFMACLAASRYQPLSEMMQLFKRHLFHRNG